MSEIIGTISENPFAAGAACFVALLIVYFLFKSLIKLALILIIVAVAIGGYYYFKHPDSRPADLKEAVERAVDGAGKAVDQGKEAYEKGRELVERGKVVLDKGKEVVERGSEAAGKILGKEKGDEERR